MIAYFNIYYVVPTHILLIKLIVSNIITWTKIILQIKHHIPINVIIM